MKLEKDNDEDTMRTNILKKISDDNGSINKRSGRQRIANQRYEDYELKRLRRKKIEEIGHRV